MSSIPNPVTRPQRPAGGSVPVRQTTDDVRQALHQHLRKTASFIKFMDVLVLLFAWLAGMLLIWLAACAIDHWVWPLASWGRWLFWMLGVSATLWWLGWQLLPLVVRRINPVYAARRIEHLVPEFKNGLISWLELETLPAHGVPRGVMAALAYRASRFIGGQDPSATVDTSPLIKIIGCVLLLSTGLVLYTILSPKSTFVTAERVLFPWSSLAPPTRVQILEVKPGAIELTQGKPLEVVVAVKGLRRDEQVAVLFTTLDGQLENQRTALTATTQGFRYAGRVATDSQGVQQPLDYWIEAGDASSGPYRVRLSPLPSVVLHSVELQYPAYTKLAPRTVSGDKVEAIEGTRALIQAQANQPLSRGRLEINPTLDEAGELVQAQAFIDMDINQRQLQVPLTLQLDSAGTNPTQVEYRIRGYNQRGDANPRPITHALSVLADMPPEVTLIGPENRVLRVRADSRINLEIRASDPDFGLSRLSLMPSRNGVPAPDITLLESDGVRGRQVKTYSIDLSHSRAAVGERFEVVAVAADNRHDPRTQQPAPNITRSQPLVLQVVGPDETPDVPPNPSQPAGEPAQPPSNQPGKSPADGTTADEPQPAANQENNPANDGGNQPANPPGGEQSPEPGSKSPADSQQNSEQSGEPSENQQPGADGSGGRGSQGEQEAGSEGQPQPGGNASSSSGGGAASSQQSGESGQSSSGNAGQQTGSDGARPDSQKNASGGSGTSSGESTSGSSQAGNDAAGSESASSSDPGSGSQSAGSQGGKPASDSEAFQRVNDYLQSQPTAPANDQQSTERTQPNGNADSQTASGQSGSDPSSTPSDPAGAKSPSQSPSDAQAPSNQSRPDNSAGPADASQSSKSQSDGQAADDKSAAGKSADGKSADGKSADGKGADGQDADGKSADGKSADGKGADGKGADGKGADDKSAGGKGADGKGADGKSADGKSADGKGADDKSAGGKSADGKSADGQGADGKSADGQGADGKSADGQGADGKSADGKSADGKSADGKSADGQGADGKSADGKSADGKSADGKSADGKSADGKSADGKSADGKSADGKSADGKSADGKSADEKGADNPDSNSGVESQAPESSGSESTAAPSQDGAQSQGSPPASSDSAGASKASGRGSSTAPAGGSGTGTQGGEGGGSGQRDATNREYADKTTQMVLDYLNRQKDQPDPELLRQLDWTPQDMQRFVERWNRARDLADSQDPAERNKWAEMLEDLNLRPADQEVRQGSDRNDAFQQMRDSGGRMRVPASLQKQFDAYRKAIERAR